MKSRRWYTSPNFTDSPYCLNLLYIYSLEQIKYCTYYFTRLEISSSYPLTQWPMVRSLMSPIHWAIKVWGTSNISSAQLSSLSSDKSDLMEPVIWIVIYLHYLWMLVTDVKSGYSEDMWVILCLKKSLFEINAGKISYDCPSIRFQKVLLSITHSAVFVE